VQAANHAELTHAIAVLAAADAEGLRRRLEGPVPAQPILWDAPPFPFLFEPFLIEYPGEKPADLIVVPRPADAPPLATTLAGLVNGSLG
jgi:hypothetical protein